MKEDVMENFIIAQDALYDHVGFIPDWVVCPIYNATDCYWGVDGSTVKYAETKGEYETESGQFFMDELYTQRFYKKHIYVGVKYTMIMCDPHVDGVKWFRFFDNEKRMEG